MTAANKPPSASQECHLCGGAMRASETSYLIDRGERIVRIEGVPCSECARCGERILTASVSREIDRLLSDARPVREIRGEVFEYPKAA